MTAVLACTSHLLVDLPLFGGPALTVIGAVVLMARSERRRAADADRAEPSEREAARVASQGGAAGPSAGARAAPVAGAGGA